MADKTATITGPLAGQLALKRQYAGVSSSSDCPAHRLRAALRPQPKLVAVSLDGREVYISCAAFRTARSLCMLCAVPFATFRLGDGRDCLKPGGVCAWPARGWGFCAGSHAKRSAPLRALCVITASARTWSSSGCPRWRTVACGDNAVHDMPRSQLGCGTLSRPPPCPAISRPPSNIKCVANPVQSCAGFLGFFSGPCRPMYVGKQIEVLEKKALPRARFYNGVFVQQLSLNMALSRDRSSALSPVRLQFKMTFSREAFSNRAPMSMKAPSLVP